MPRLRVCSRDDVVLDARDVEAVQGDLSVGVAAGAEEGLGGPDQQRLGRRRPRTRSQEFPLCE